MEGALLERFILENRKIKKQVQVKLHPETIDKINSLANEKGISADDLYQEACNLLLDVKKIKKAITNSQLLSATNAAKYLGISRITLWRKVQAGKVSPVDIGGHLKYDKQQLDKLIEDQRVN
jgi:excisionase family DNA binding protein